MARIGFLLEHVTSQVRRLKRYNGIPEGLARARLDYKALSKDGKENPVFGPPRPATSHGETHYTLKEPGVIGSMLNAVPMWCDIF